MSDIKEALVHSEQNAITALGETAKACAFPVIALPTGVLVHDLEEYQKHRNQFRGRLKTHSIDDFTKYANLQEGGDCYINRDDMAAKAIFDIGTIDQPGHCKHTAFIALKDTAAFRVFNNKDNNRIGQQDLAEFIEDWKDSVKVFERFGDEEPMDIKAAAMAIRNVTITEKSSSDHGTQSFSTNRSAIEELNATSKDKPLPGAIEFSCVPYNGLIERTFTLRISMIIRKGDTPMFSLRSVKLDEVLEEMQNEFIDLVTAGLASTIVPYIGSFNTDG